MRDYPLLQEAFDLTDAILNVQIDVVNEADVMKDDWSQVAYFYLVRSREALKAISLSLYQRMLSPAAILVRYTFELGVRLRYMDANPEKVSDYLRHSRVIGVEGRDPEQQGLDLLEQEDYATFSEKYILKHSWGNLRVLCKEIDKQSVYKDKLLNLYEMVYRTTSEISHGGGRGMSREFSKLFGHEKTPDWELANPMCTALGFYTWIVGINCKVIPPLASNFRLGGDWNNRLAALQNDINAASIIYARQHQQHNAGPLEADR